MRHRSVLVVVCLSCLLSCGDITENRGVDPSSADDSPMVSSAIETEPVDRSPFTEPCASGPTGPTELLDIEGPGARSPKQAVRLLLASGEDGSRWSMKQLEPGRVYVDVGLASGDYRYEVMRLPDGWWPQWVSTC